MEDLGESTGNAQDIVIACMSGNSIPVSRSNGPQSIEIEIQGVDVL